MCGHLCLSRSLNLVNYCSHNTSPLESSRKKKHEVHVDVCDVAVHVDVCAVVVLLLSWSWSVLWLSLDLVS